MEQEKICFLGCSNSRVTPGLRWAETAQFQNAQRVPAPTVAHSLPGPDLMSDRDHLLLTVEHHGLTYVSYTASK